MKEDRPSPSFPVALPGAADFFVLFEDLVFSLPDLFSILRSFGFHDFFKLRSDGIAVDASRKTFRYGQFQINTS